MSSRANGRLSLRPLGLLGPAESEASDEPLMRLAGGALSFSRCEAVWRAGRAVRRAVLPLAAIAAWADEQEPGQGQAAEALLQSLGRPRPPLCGLDFDRPRIMGILNTTPDSFSDGGDRLDPEVAVGDGLAMLKAGAEILDVGGESTRPGAKPVSLAEEQERVLPVVRALAEAGAVVSIDTRHAEVMAAAVEAGASIINDVTALTGDPESLSVAAGSGRTVVLMHMQGEPQTMQRDPRYDHAAHDIYDFLAARIKACRAAGIAVDQLVVDPGIGFGKSLTHNLQVLEQIALYHGLGCPVLLGASRKSFIAKLSQGEAAKERLPGSLAAILFALQRGVQILRVHDVAETAQAVAVWQAMTRVASGFASPDNAARPLL